jgi:hypothetical protein
MHPRPAGGILRSSIGKQQMTEDAMTNNVLLDLLPLIALGLAG